MEQKDKSNEENDKSQHTFLTLEDIFVQNNLCSLSSFSFLFSLSRDQFLVGSKKKHLNPPSHLVAFSERTLHYSLP